MCRSGQEYDRIQPSVREKHRDVKEIAGGTEEFSLLLVVVSATQ